MSSSYVYRGPANSPRIHSGVDKLAFKPATTPPAKVENIVTSQLEKPSKNYHVQTPNFSTKTQESTPEYCQIDDESISTQVVEDSKGVVDADYLATVKEELNKMKEESGLQEFLNNVPEEWKKYALIAGLTLLGRKILFGGKK